MIKRIVFDVDNTLLDTEKDCLDSYKIYFKRKGLPDYSQFLYELVDEYDRQNGSYEPEDLTNFIDKNSPFTFTIEDFNELYGIYREHGTLLEKDIENTLAKLSKKYELVALTSWYYEDQRARLEVANLLKYFKEVYAYENAGLKPHKEAYEVACKGLKMSECLCVGDSIVNDVTTPLSLGMQVLYYNPSKKETEYKCIYKISDLLKEKNL